MDSSNFTDWRKSLHKHSLFFNGASKENPGGGGVLFDPEDILEFSLSLGIGVDTNNIIEALALWQGLYQTLAYGISEVNVFGDSRVIIQALVTHKLPTQLRLRQIVRNIQTLLTSFR